MNIVGKELASNIIIGNRARQARRHASGLESVFRVSLPNELNRHDTFCCAVLVRRNRKASRGAMEILT